MHTATSIPDDANCKFSLLLLLSMEPWAMAKKTSKLVWQCHQHLPRVLHQSHLHLPGNKGDNEMIAEVVHTSPGICLTAEENLSMETIDEGCATSHHHLKWCLLLPNEVGRMRSVGLHSISGNK